MDIKTVDIIKVFIPLKSITVGLESKRICKTYVILTIKPWVTFWDLRLDIEPDRDEEISLVISS